MSGVLLAAITRGDAADYVSAFIRVYSLLILAYIILSLVYAFARLPYSRVLTAIFEFLREISEPLLAPIRRILPRMGAFDFSPIVALLALNIVGSIVVALIRG